MEILEKLFRDQREINPADYNVCLGEFPIAEGGSTVYKGKNRDGDLVALKVYKRIVVGQIGLPEVLRYQKITQRAKYYLEGKGVFLNRRDGGQNKFSWEVNPINRVGKLKSGEACSISGFIEGPTLQEEIEKGRYDVSFIEEALKVISGELNENIGTIGISLVPVNVKVVGEQLVVTDLYAQVQRLREEKS